MFTCTVFGNLGQDAITNFSPDGLKFLSFSIAVRLVDKKKDEEKPQWVKCSCIYNEKFHGKIFQYLKKGTSLIILGNLVSPTIYNGESKINVRIININLAGKSNNQNESDESKNYSNSYNNNSNKSGLNRIGFDNRGEPTVNKNNSNNILAGVGKEDDDIFS